MALADLHVRYVAALDKYRLTFEDFSPVLTVEGQQIVFDTMEAANEVRKANDRLTDDLFKRLSVNSAMRLLEGDQ